MENKFIFSYCMKSISGQVPTAAAALGSHPYFFKPFFFFIQFGMHLRTLDYVM